MRINSLQATQQFRDNFNKVYSERLKKHKGYKDPPWADRKNQEIVRSLAHPQINRDLGIMLLCRKESILAIHQVLIEYLVKNYALSFETAESWVLYFATRSIKAILPTTQIDGVRFFNDELKIAGPGVDKKLAYKNLQDDIKRGDPYVNIRIGRSATKQDAQWFLDRYWEKHIAPVIKLPYQAPEQREKRKLLRNSTIYALHENCIKVRNIQNYIADNFDEAVEESAIRKVLKEFKPPVDLFKPAADTLDSMPQDIMVGNKLNLIFLRKPTPHFQVTEHKP